MAITITIDTKFLLAASGLTFLLFLASLWVCRHTDFLFVLRQHLRRFAPLYFVAGPSAITYLAVCGAASSSLGPVYYLFHNDYSQAYANQHGLYTMFHWVEYTCSFVGALGFAWLIRWVGLSRLWTAMLFVSLSVCAAYRNARVGTGPMVSSGPTILLSPQWLDAIPVALGFCLFLFLFRQHDKRNGQYPLSSTSQRHSLIARLWFTSIIAVVILTELMWIGLVISGNGTGESSLVTVFLFPVLFTIGIISHFRFHNT